MKSLVKLQVLSVAILSQAISIAPGFAQPVKASVGATAVAIISGHPSSTVATLPVSATQSAPAITVSVPQVVPFGAQTNHLGKMQITNLVVTLNFNDTTDVTLTFVSPDNFANPTDNSWRVTLKPEMPVDPTCLSKPTAVKCHDFPTPSNLLRACVTCMDNITIVPGSSDSGSMQFVVFFALLSNYNVGGDSKTSRCASTQTHDPKKYQIVPDQEVTGVCVDSYSKPLLECTNNHHLIHLIPPDDLVASVDGASCGK